LRLAICNEMFDGLPLSEVFSIASSLGYDAVEVAPFTISSSVRRISPEERRRIHDLAHERGIAVAGTHWILISDLNLMLFDQLGGCRRETVDYLKDVVIFTADIGGEVVVFGSPRQRSVPSPELLEVAKRNAAHALGEIGDLAEECSVIFCIEPLSKDQTNFVNTASEAVELIDDAGGGGLGLILDVRSMCDESKTFSEIIALGSKHLKHFHANDCNGYIPGSGSADYRQIMSSLKMARYDRYLSVEVFDSRPSPFHVARESIKKLREFMGWGEPHP
jgi:D-psicose/D-tagatose/L-ribulose 3-epimerase